MNTTKEEDQISHRRAGARGRILGITVGLAAASAAPPVTWGDADCRRPEHHRTRQDPGDRLGVDMMAQPHAVGSSRPSAGCGGPHYNVWGDGRPAVLFDRNYPAVRDDVDGFVRATDRRLEWQQPFEIPARTSTGEGRDRGPFVRPRFVEGDGGSRIQNTDVVNGCFPAPEVLLSPELEDAGSIP